MKKLFRGSILERFSKKKITHIKNGIFTLIQQDYFYLTHLSISHHFSITFILQKKNLFANRTCVRSGKIY